MNLKKTIVNIGIGSLVAITVISFLSNKKEFDKKIKEIPNDYLFNMRAYPKGTINTLAYKNAIVWKKSLNEKNTLSNNIWEFTGPTNVGGRITDIEIPSNLVNTYYVGAASGGIFKSTDAGNSWIPIFDDQSMLSIGDIEISKTDNNLIFVGTGEVNAGGGSLAYDGNGIFKSTDAGLTWQNKGLENVGSISKVLINPQDDNTIFVGAMGPLFRNDVNRGVYRSTNGGDNWEKVLFVSDSTGIIDMAIHPTNPNIVYAASWERIRRPNNRTYGGETSRIYRSQDAGTTWAELTNGLPSNPDQKGRISIDISQSNPNILYASYSNKAGYIQGAYKTIDGGNTWTSISTSGIANLSYRWWFGGFFIDPTDAGTIYDVGYRVCKSTNGGNSSWSTISSTIHVDQHAMAFNTQDPNIILLGNDGGLYKSTNNGNSFLQINNLPITQFYHYTVDEQNDYKRYGGAQDNGTIRTETGANDDWQSIYGGDGFQTLIDPTNTNTIYALYQNGILARSLNNGNSFITIFSANYYDRKNWNTPITFDPSNYNTLYYGANKLYKTTNQGYTWQSISPDLTNGPYTGNLTFGTITTIDVSPVNTNIIYVGTDDGNVWVTEDAGSNWINITTGLPNLWTTKVKASPTDENIVYVTFSGYRYGEDNGHIFMSNNKGNTWDNISSNLPNIPINDIEIDNFNNLFLGTDIGVLASNNNGNTWNVFGENFPSVVVTDLYYHKTSNYLYAGTYGRSSYKIDLTSNTLNTVDNELENITIFPNPVNDILHINTDKNILTYVIFDVNGKKIKQNKINGDPTINVNTMPKGVYFIKFFGENDKTVTKKIIKR